ncbi:hypothetical protein JMJ77_0015395, partial [Colletotrichum scovillei]
TISSPPLGICTLRFSGSCTRKLVQTVVTDRHLHTRAYNECLCKA